MALPLWLSTLVVVLLSTTSAARDLPPPPPPRDGGGYVVVIDAGSTGSRAHVYRWSAPPSSPSSSSSPPAQLLPHVVEAAPSLKREPGLSSTKPSEVAAALEPLLEHAALHVPREHHATTDVLILATAGLRALPTQRERDERLSAAREAVARLSPFPEPREGAVATLRGVDEGALAWVAANAAAGSLVEGGRARRASPGEESVPATVGIAEVGGTSMQVTFEVVSGEDDGASGASESSGSDGAGGGVRRSPSAPTAPSSPEDVFFLELPSAIPSSRASPSSSPVVFRLFSRSWEGLGHEAARATTAAAVTLSSSSSASSSSSPFDPCVPPGAVVPLPPDVASSSGEGTTSTSPRSLPPPPPPPQKTSAVGSGDFDACRDAASRALRLACEERPDHCPLSTFPSTSSSPSRVAPLSETRNERPPPMLSGMEVIGIENLRHTAHALGLLGGRSRSGLSGGGRPTLREIVEAGKRLCSSVVGDEAPREEGAGGGGGERQGKEASSQPEDEHLRRESPFHVNGPVEAARHCFGAAYTVALLHDAFGVGLDERGVEFSGSVAVAHEKQEKRVTPEWTSAAASLAAATRATSTKSARAKTKGSPKPLPFESLLRRASDGGETSSVPSVLAGAFLRRRGHRRLTLAGLFVFCGAFSAAAVAVRSLAASSSLSLGGLPGHPRRRRRQKISALGDGDEGGPTRGPDASSDAASDALGSGEGSPPVRGGAGGGASSKGWKLSKRGAGGDGSGSGSRLDLAAEASSSPSTGKSSLLP